MCGVVGICSLRGEPVDPQPLERMLGILRHRGPDATGVWAEGPVALGHARLSIIDLAGGSQPMRSQGGDVCITFNGEIFNYVELREELVRRGHRFRTRSDTEVILHLYEEKGEDCVHDLNGQWAFAIWDRRRRSLFLSRDRVGVRPLYYTVAEGQFLFASEVKALFAHGAPARRIDLRGLDQVLTFWTPIAPRTVFENVKQLPPGASMRVCDGKTTTWSHWDVRFEQALGHTSIDENAERLRERLIDATRLRLRADVPTGAYLSGGLDSSIVVAMIARFTDTPLRTFSITFEDPEYDESAFQKEVARHLGTDHYPVHCTKADIGRVFPAVIWHAETPLVRTAPAPLYLLAQRVRADGLKVVLTGEGSDEVLGGYDIFKEAKIRAFWARQPQSRLRPLLLRRLYPYMKNIQAQPPAYLRAFFHVSGSLRANPFFSHLPRWDLTAKAKLLYAPAVREALAGHDPFEAARALLPPDFERWDLLEQAQFLEMRILMPGYILASQADRVAMAHSVEARFPFLDVGVMELAARMPPTHKMKVLDEKHVLKRAARDLLPPSVLQRPKQPYRAPDGESLLGGANGVGRPDYVRALLDPRRIEVDGLFDADAVTKLVAKFDKGRAIGVRDDMAVVSVISTQLLLEQYINGFRG